MENRQEQILSEIKSMMASIRSQLELLDAKMAELQQVVDPEEFAAESVDIDLDVEETPESAQEEVVTVQEIPMEEDLPESIFGDPEVVTIAEKVEEKVKPTINDMMADDCAWRKDMPGAPVRDIRSAISLNDRVIFINLLFDEDAQKFVNTLTQINAMERLDQAVEYLAAEFPEWDFNSELVYRFMMAVRRKLQ